jgi:hypothetical protein
MNGLNPLAGLGIYYAVVFATILLLQVFGLVVGGTKFSGPLTAIGGVLVVFSFFIIFNQTSCYINETVNGQCDTTKVSQVYQQSEDGAVYWLWSKAFPGDSAEQLQLRRVMTYVVTPFILTALGVLLIVAGGGKTVELSAL